MLRLQSDERLVALVRRGSSPAFEMLVSRYESRLLAFCRHLLGSREDAEDVLQEVMAAAYKALLADDRPINVRPWLYRIARNRSLNHLRRRSAVGVDSMDIHLSEHGASTADKANQREDFRLLVGDIRELPETQRTALVLREMDALSYEQIAEAMETTVPSVKSLLVRARVSLAEAAEARLLTCDEVRDELGEVAEGLKRKPSPAVRRHLKACKRCDAFRIQLKETNRALAAILPLGPLVVLKKLALSQLGHHASGAAAAGSGATAAGSGAGVAGGTAAGSSIVAGSTAGGFSFVSAGLGAIASKAAVGFAAAAIVTAGAVEVDHTSRTVKHHATPIAAVTYRPHTIPAATRVTPAARSWRYAPSAVIKRHVRAHKPAKAILVAAVTKATSKPAPTKTVSAPTPPAAPVATTPTPTSTTPPPGRTSTETVPTVLTPPPPPIDLTPVTTTTPVVTAAPPTTPPATSPLAPPPSVISPTPTPPAGTTPPPPGPPTPPAGTGPTGTPPTGGSSGGGPATP